MKRTHCVMAALLVLLARPLKPQVGQSVATGLRIVHSAPIAADDLKNPHFESFLAVDPLDSRHLIATSMSGTSEQGNGAQFFVYVTFDGGRHWMRGTTKPGPPELYSSGDPAVYFNSKGTAFFVAGVRKRKEDKGTTVISHSTNGGRTWSDLKAFPYRDRPWLAFDESGAEDPDAASPFDGAIYFAGMNYIQGANGAATPSMLLSRSRDEGLSFDPGQLYVHDDAGTNLGKPLNVGALVDPIVAPGGLLIIPFIGHVADPGTPMETVLSQKVLAEVLRVIVSDDGGRTFRPMREGPRLFSMVGYRGILSASAPRAAIDRSHGPHRNQIYVVWTSYNENRDLFVVELQRSSDFGATWQTTVVNDDQSGHEPSNPAIDVSKDGIVAVIWNDRRDDPKGDCWRLYGAVSIDGGEHFLPNAKLSDSPSCPNSPKNWKLSTWFQRDTWTDPKHPLPGFGVTAFVPTRFANGGDTQSLVADKNDVFHAGWINGASGVLQLWLTDFVLDSELVAKVRATNTVATAAPGGPPPPQGWEDLSQELGFEMSNPKIDFSESTLTVDMRIVNPNGRKVSGPIQVVVYRLITESSKAMGLHNLHAVNADNGKADIGAAWTFDTDRLSRGKGSTAKTLRFKFEGGMPSHPDGYFEPLFHIYGKKSENAKAPTRGTRRLTLGRETAGANNR